jgi:hypothetical protein
LVHGHGRPGLDGPRGGVPASLRRFQRARTRIRGHPSAREGVCRISEDRRLSIKKAKDARHQQNSRVFVFSRRNRHEKVRCSEMVLSL